MEPCEKMIIWIKNAWLYTFVDWSNFIFQLQLFVMIERSPTGLTFSTEWNNFAFLPRYNLHLPVAIALLRLRHVYRMFLSTIFDKKLLAATHRRDQNLLFADNAERVVHNEQTFKAWFIDYRMPVKRLDWQLALDNQ